MLAFVRALLASIAVAAAVVPTASAAPAIPARPAVSVVPGRPAAPAVPARPSASCTVHTGKTASPTTVDLGGEVEIALSLSAECPGSGAAGRADIVLAIDRSASQADNGTWEPTIRAATAFVDLVDFSRHQVAILTFSGQFLGLGPVTVLHQELSSDAAAVKASLAAVPGPPWISGGTNLTAAVTDSQIELTSARHRAGAIPVIVLLTDGGHNVDTPVTPIQAAQAAKDAGTLVVTIGLALDEIASDTLLAMATRPSLYFPAPTGADLEQVFRDLAGSVGGTGRLSGVDVIDYIAAEFDYVPGSAVPAPVEVTAGYVRWRIADLAETGWTARYRVRALVVGKYNTNKLAYVDYIDADGSIGTRDFPVPIVTVRLPVATPTPSPEPTTPTQPASTPTPVPPTPTPTPDWASSVHLPIVYRSYCHPVRPFDLALVLDTSSSMWGDKLDATRAGARTFLGYLLMPPTRAAVIAFNEDATVVQPLTDDVAAARAALDRLPQAEGSRIDLALRAATALLAADADPRRQAVTILITDGQQVGGTAQDALDAAAAARMAGIAVYAIGIGADVDPTILQRIAGHPDRFYNAPTAAELAGVYEAIAGEMPCRLGR